MTVAFDLISNPYRSRHALFDKIGRQVFRAKAALDLARRFPPIPITIALAAAPGAIAFAARACARPGPIGRARSTGQAEPRFRRADNGWWGRQDNARRQGDDLRRLVPQITRRCRTRGLRLMGLDMEFGRRRRRWRFDIQKHERLLDAFLDVAGQADQQQIAEQAENGCRPRARQQSVLNLGLQLRSPSA